MGEMGEMGGMETMRAVWGLVRRGLRWVGALWSAVAAGVTGCDADLVEWRSGRLELVAVDGRRLDEDEPFAMPLGGVGTLVPGRPWREAMVVLNDTSETVAVSLTVEATDGAARWEVLEATRPGSWPLVGARLIPPGGRLDFDLGVVLERCADSEARLVFAWGTSRGGRRIIPLETRCAGPTTGASERDRGEFSEAEEVELAKRRRVARVPAPLAVAQKDDPEPIGRGEECDRAALGERALQGRAQDEGLARKLQGVELDPIGGREEEGLASEPNGLTWASAFGKQALAGGAMNDEIVAAERDQQVLGVLRRAHEASRQCQGLLASAGCRIEDRQGVGTTRPGAGHATSGRPRDSPLGQLDRPALPPVGQRQAA